MATGRRKLGRTWATDGAYIFLASYSRHATPDFFGVHPKKVPLFYAQKSQKSPLGEGGPEQLCFEPRDPSAAWIVHGVREGEAGASRVGIPKQELGNERKKSLGGSGPGGD